MKKGEKLKPGSLKGGKNMPSAKAKVGSGKRFAALKEKLVTKGASNPSALAAAIGRAKMNAKKMSHLAKKGKK